MPSSQAHVPSVARSFPPIHTGPLAPAASAAARTAAFRVADQDDTGSVRSKDLREILHRFAIDLTPQQFVELLNDLNADSDGTINYHTFIRHFQEKAAPSQLLQLHKYPVKVAVKMIIHMGQKGAVYNAVAARSGVSFGQFDE